MLFFVMALVFLGCIYALFYLTSGKVNQKTDSVTIKTEMSIQEVVDQLRKTASELKANVDKIQDDPFGQYGSSENVAVVLHGEERGLNKDVWAVQVYVNVVDHGCQIELVAVGEGLSAGYTGTYYTGRINLSGSKKRRDIIASKF